MDIYNQEKEDLKEYVIYKITNLVNCKCYVGRTCDFNNRIKQHQKETSECTFLRNAIQKYGWDNFITEILEHCIGDKLTAEREKYNIWLYDSFGPLGYNLTTGGENYTVSEETCKLISEKLTGIKRTEEQRLKVTGENHWTFGLSKEEHPNTGKKRTEDFILKISGENHWTFGMSHEDHPNTGKKRTEEQILKVTGENNWCYGKIGEEHPAFGTKRTEEQRLKVTGENHWTFGLSKEEHPNYGENNWMFGKTGELSPNYGENNWMFGKTGELSPSYGLKRSEEQRLNQSKRQRKIFLITFPDGHTEITDNLKQFCIDNKLTYSCMLLVSNKHQKQHKGFRCEHYDEK